MNKQTEISDLPRRIHELRKHKKYTLEDLAKCIGRSVGFVSQIERGLSQPTVADLTAISETLGVPTTYFFNDSLSQGSPWVTRPDERRILHYANGISDILLSPTMTAAFSMLETTLQPGASSGERQLSDSSEQGGYVLEGELTLLLGLSEEQIVLQVGDTFQLPSRTQCRYCNSSKSTTRILWIYT
ncbi:helix-turn-helix domain-containing protein [Pseudomonas brassicacearum]|uniref:helix-turn-helix domain-containing protein n=1 Tax=Pseudomonas brassicacearum TaxID=930166 RepID=UPI0009B68571|nr:XRE family transcriptional regulator [Pseudomonas brassicacearum]